MEYLSVLPTLSTKKAHKQYGVLKLLSHRKFNESDYNDLESNLELLYDSDHWKP